MPLFFLSILTLFCYFLSRSSLALSLWIHTHTLTQPRTPMDTPAWRHLSSSSSSSRHPPSSSLCEERRHGSKELRRTPSIFRSSKSQILHFLSLRLLLVISESNPPFLAQVFVGFELGWAHPLLPAISQAFNVFPISSERFSTIWRYHYVPFNLYFPFVSRSGSRTLVFRPPEM